MLGSCEPLDEERRWLHAESLADEDLLIEQAMYQLDNEYRIEQASGSNNTLEHFYSHDLPPIHVYRVPYSVDGSPINLDDFDDQKRNRILERVATIRRKHQKELETGIDDDRHPIDPVRRSWFEKQVTEFDPDNYPEEIPSIFNAGSCNIFGHICPVFFAAEAFTETDAERRRGRYIPFCTKMRVVRRDNHTCQICGVHLRDDEVEFDHIIPLSRGGSSEEHNIRLTCFDCNRDKKDKVVI
jgi:hypothetical protein